jgi:nucleoside-diphosphate-sugar epimerase
MRVVVVGASGNVGTSVLAALAGEAAVDTVVGIARRIPGETSFAKTEWVEADVVSDDLVPLFRGADAVVHLAWLIQPSRDSAMLRAVNVDGSERVFRAAGEAGVGALVYASSIGAYSAGPKDRRVDESWPTDGIAPSFYSLHKAETERMLDRFELEFPSLRVVRLRKALIFKRDAAEEIRRYFIGPFVPASLLRPGRIPVVPDIERLVFQAVHSLDVGEAYRLALVRDDARGAYNVAAEPVLGPDELARLFRARKLRVPARVVRAGAALAWRARLTPTPEGWVDMGLGVPIMDVSRIRNELGWEPQHTSGEALLELLEGMRAHAGAETPPLAPQSSGPARVRELATGLGRKNF